MDSTQNKIRALDFGECAKGIKLCLDNAKALLEEAKILHNKEKYRGSVVLSLFAWEELAKIVQIFNLLDPINKDDIKKRWRKFWKEFRSHEKKLISSFTNKIVADIEKNGGKEIEYINKDKPSKGMPDLIALKEACLYVNCDYNSKKFISPYPILKDMSEGIMKDVNDNLESYKLLDKEIVKDIEDALREYGGDEYWEKRFFEPDSEKIIGKVKEIESRGRRE